ncbi:MAG TPA: diguanylate cyclase [Thermoanaerobaculia bacterium]|nr:diguanylate cyclase [Thermoanaerobaculia bacterium]HUM28895.1 diguanylate cyclase [Thermoanaerobaculia bacterium]HXK67172.1 diguanylate cyclase [Thermoanaerobaculia bacterium]
MKILVVDDSASVRGQVKELLSKSVPGVEIQTANNGIETLSLAEKFLPDMIIMDVQMPGMNGYEALRVLKSRERTREIPVIFLTGTYREEEDLITGLELGAVDYVMKPIQEKIFMARVKVMLRLKEAQEGIRRLSLHDPLTECFNRRFLMKRLSEEFNRGARNHHPVSGIMLDLDHFKQLNDAYGHDVGDQVLVKVANILKLSMREYDVLARYGGEEFFILLPQTDLENAIKMAERIRSLIQSVRIEAGERQLSVTASFGVAGYSGEETPDNPEHLLKQADIALYRAKENGRNRVEVFRPEQG